LFKQIVIAYAVTINLFEEQPLEYSGYRISRMTLKHLKIDTIQEAIERKENETMLTKYECIEAKFHLAKDSCFIGIINWFRES